MDSFCIFLPGRVGPQAAHDLRVVQASHARGVRSNQVGTDQEGTLFASLCVQSLMCCCTQCQGVDSNLAVLSAPQCPQFEITEAEEISAKFLGEELYPKAAEKQGFAKPSRPGTCDW